ncbi:hypothetical protein P280DRAFT_472500 [Massarina eburnea CBS 473.64]|uniref:F-box domain-containing protein n=1 Tax=Massarina eburnea CBS 473.64 TaxID=1395130 RepID=A0A6A6RQT9_9PLEO|nr:hypothetical protein P280DRAFT_472500 [Massarina eburnea CBS 473.64]
MSPFLRLPPELLEEIYHYLGSIDDVHHFGRTCKSTLHVIQRQTVYTEIMRSIIGTSSQHRFDVSLSRMLDLHRDIVRRYTQVLDRPVRATQPQVNPHGGVIFNDIEHQLVTAVTNTCPHGPCRLCLPDTRVHEILARYQGLRLLEDQWLRRQLRDIDVVSVDCSKDNSEFIRLYQIVLGREEDFRDGNFAPRSSDEAETCTGFNADQRGRFHCAIVSLWLLNEIRWVLTQFRYPSPTFTLQIRMLEVCKRFITEDSAIPIVEELDRFAVFRFMYQHLLPVHGSFLADRCSSKLPLTFPSDLEKHSLYCARFLQVFLLAGQTYMQPPDIIDLLVRSRTSRKPPYPLLILPHTTDLYRIPASAFRCPTGLDYTSPDPARIMDKRLLMRNSINHLNIIGRASIKQSEMYPNSHWFTRANGTDLFDIVDDMSTWLREKALVRFDMHSKRLAARDWTKIKGIKTVFAYEWERVWWRIWWWANSEDKAVAKMERWRIVDTGVP